MPSLQHTLFKLSAVQLRKAISMDISQIAGLRRVLDISSVALYLPMGVSSRSMQVNGVPAEWLSYAGADPASVLLFLHGGGYAVGSPQTHRGLAGRIAQESGIPALLIDYRLAPEHPFPAALQDAVHAYQWLLEEGYAPERIVLAGDSAGGGLCLSTLLSLRELALPLPRACVCLSPWVDLSFSGESAQRFAEEDPIVSVKEVRNWAHAYAGDYPVGHPMISPLFADLGGLPPVLIQASENEVLSDDALRLAQRLQAAGNPVELQTWAGVLHVWQLFWRLVPEAEEAIEQIGAFIGEQLARRQAA
jgi:acetyl esterase/lipase